LGGALCTSTVFAGPFGWGGGDNAPTRNVSVKPAVALGQPVAKPSIGTRMYNSVAQTGASVAEAITPQTKVIPVADPIGLDTPATGLTTETHLQSGQLHERNGRFAAAEDQYRRALAKSPNDLSVLLHLGRLFDRQEKYNEAIGTYEHAIKTYADSAVARNDLGLCYARMGEIGRATAMLEQAVAKAPANQMYRNNIATVLVDQGRSDLAFQHLAQVYPKAVAHYNVGVLLYKQEEMADAAMHFQAASQLDPRMNGAAQLAARLAPPRPTGNFQTVAATTTRRASDDVNIPAVRQPVVRQVKPRSTSAPLAPTPATAPDDWNRPKRFPPAE